ncbi:hypothetical protein [Streptomyces coryli]|uniref:hypothetical protein n=1 Tax=Streptomyces coryli TaxID=1128680 RepID=UPI0019CF7EF9|nr:hypothetical protein [Streptomyces coryli]
MSWSWKIGPHDFDTISALPSEAQPPLLELIDALEADPYALSEPYGIDDGVTRQATFGDVGVLVFMANPRTERLTPLSIVWAAE